MRVGVVEFAVVQVRQGGGCLGVGRIGAHLFGAGRSAPQHPEQTFQLAGQQRHIAIGVEQLVAGRLQFSRCGIRAQQPLLDHFTQAQLGRAMGAEQAGVGRQRQVLTRLGMLHFVEQDGGQQHRIDPGAPALPQHGRLQGFQPVHGVAPQRRELIHATGEQLGQPRLGAMHAESPLQLTQFGRCEARGVGVRLLGGQHQVLSLLALLKHVAARQQHQTCGDGNPGARNRSGLRAEPQGRSATNPSRS